MARSYQAITTLPGNGENCPDLDLKSPTGYGCPARRPFLLIGFASVPREG
jgi:hypothetical protein